MKDYSLNAGLDVILATVAFATVAVFIGIAIGGFGLPPVEEEPASGQAALDTPIVYWDDSPRVRAWKEGYAAVAAAAYQAQGFLSVEGPPGEDSMMRPDFDEEAYPDEYASLSEWRYRGMQAAIKRARRAAAGE